MWQFVSKIGSFFLSGLSFTESDNSQDSRGRQGKKEIEQLMSKYKYGNDIHGHGQQQNK